MSKFFKFAKLVKKSSNYQVFNISFVKIVLSAWKSELKINFFILNSTFSILNSYHMFIFHKVTDLTVHMDSIRRKKKDIQIGFVPTMGALHEGHLSLIRRSRAENSITICSIYVNPLQFNDPEDFKKYPRNYEADIKMLENELCNIVFMPDADEMQPAGEYPDYDLAGLDNIMEGKFRPGHFRGVAYIVKKFFEIIKPQKAYFGLKDFQQFTIIQHIVKSLRLHTIDSRLVEIVGCEIVRESDGLAMSSRNIRLSQQQRKAASDIFWVLLELKELYRKKNTGYLKQWVKNQIENTSQMKLEYIEIVNSQTLLPVVDKNERNAIACIAVNLGEIRLIDNMMLTD